MDEHVHVRQVVQELIALGNEKKLGQKKRTTRVTLFGRSMHYLSTALVRAGHQARHVLDDHGHQPAARAQPIAPVRRGPPLRVVVRRPAVPPGADVGLYRGERVRRDFGHLAATQHGARGRVVEGAFAGRRLADQPDDEMPHAAGAGGGRRHRLVGLPADPRRRPAAVPVAPAALSRRRRCCRPLVSGTRRCI